MENTLKHYVDDNNNTTKIELGDFAVLVKKKQECWVAFSPQFKVLGFSQKNEDDAIDDLKDSLDLFFDIHVERGTLDEALNEFGWKKENDTFIKPKYFNRPHAVLGGQQKTMAYA